MILNNCIECLYNGNCPCGYSFHNAACLILAKPNEIIFNNNLDIIEMIKEYEKSK